MTAVWLITVLLIHVGYILSQNIEPHVVSTTSCDNPNCDCKTLYNYLQDGDDAYFTSNTTFVFQPGHHELNVSIAISDINNLVLTSEGEANISCSNGAGLSFMNISYLKIKGLTFIGCGSTVNIEESINRYATTFLDINTLVNVTLFFNHITDLHVTSLRVFNSTGYGVFAINIMGDSIINNSILAFNNFYNSQCSNCKGGNFILLYVDILKNCTEEPQQHTLLIASSRFHHGVDRGAIFHPARSNNGVGDIQYIGGGGLGIIETQSSYEVDITIQSTTIDQNAAYIGANMYLSVFDFVYNSSININNSMILWGNYVGNIRYRQTLGGGFSYLFGHLPKDKNVTYYTSLHSSINMTPYSKTYLTITNTDISFNDARYGGAASVHLWPKSLLAYKRDILMENVCVNSNNGRTIFYIANPSYSTYGPTFTVNFSNITFYSNSKSFPTSKTDTTLQSVIFASFVQSFNLKWCLFEDNLATALQSQQSRIYFQENNTFINNSGVDGGAIYLDEGSFMYLDEYSTVLFQNNHASIFGGAIYADMLNYKCFFQLMKYADHEVTQKLIFINNTANSAGNSIYGNVEECSLETASSRNTGQEVFRMLASFPGINTTDTQPVSSSGYRVRLCGMDKPRAHQCIRRKNTTDTQPVSSSACPCGMDKPRYGQCICRKTVSHFPGETFTLSVAAVGYSAGYGDGLTPATILSELTVTMNSTIPQLGKLQAFQRIEAGCSNLTYTIYSASLSTVNLTLYPKTLRIFQSLSVMVELKHCPMGFALSSTPHFHCDCEPILVEAEVTCNITSGYITKPNQVWVGLIEYDDSTVLATGTCPYNHCISEEEKVDVNLSSPDTQCSDNYASTLCSSCADGYSIALGSNQCLKCSNDNISLLIVFLVGGALLIVLLAVSNMTVSTGKINCLLFYANIIKVTGKELFVLQVPYFLPFSIFINWLNLDFGIESCFFNGFTAYIKAWFQFLFPLYLFLLMGIIVLAAHYSTKIARIIPSNIMPVFATVSLIAAAKLLRNSVEMFQVIELNINNGGSVNMWQFDGNVKQFGAKYISLALISALILTLIFFYALVLLSHGWLLNVSATTNRYLKKLLACVRQQMFRIIPLLDSYDAPYNEKSRYWPGLLVIIRILVSVILSQDTADVEIERFVSVIVILLSVVLVTIILVFKVYKKLRVRIYEIISIINLAVVEALFIAYKDKTDNSVVIVASISISIQFLLCIGAIIREIYKKFEKKSPTLQAKGMRLDSWIRKKWKTRKSRNSCRRHSDTFYRYESHYHYVNDGIIENSGATLLSLHLEEQNGNK